MVDVVSTTSDEIVIVSTGLTGVELLCVNTLPVLEVLETLP